MSDIIDIGSRLEPFVDDYLIERMEDLELRLNHPVRREVSLYFDEPWEGPWSGYQTILCDDDGMYRMYYRGANYGRDPREHTCVALSKDGIGWTKPEMGLYEFEGNKKTNIVWVGPGAHAFSPFIDKNPECKPEERYKAVGPVGSGKETVLMGFVSPDGYNWKRIGDEPLITDGHFDSHNLVFWDKLRGEYVCYFRKFRDGFYPGGVRDIKTCTSHNFIKWSEPQWLQYTGAPEEQLYTNAIGPYFRAPHIYLGFPKRYHRDRKDHGGDGLSDGVFMSSRDGLTFHRWREGFMRPGLDKENWVDRNQLATWGMIETKPGEISLYYLEHNYVASHNVMRATIRTDGFVSVHAGGTPGTVTTKPLTFSGKELAINYSTSGAGGVRVELQDAAGKPVPGFALDDCPVRYGDDIEWAVRWNDGSDVSSLAGKPVRIKFEVDDADLYSIRFR